MFSAYDWLFGQQSPKAESSWFDKVVSYIWRSEAAGMLGELLNPYAKRDEFNPITEPVIIRNAKLLGSKHSEVILDLTTASSILERLGSLLDEPNADTSFIPLYKICESLKGDLKVALTGDGGDVTMTQADGNLLAGDVSTSIVWNDVGDLVELVYTGAKWAVALNKGATIS